MSGEIKNILKVGGIYTASVIGAGFASGQEILRFFSVYHAGGFYGILLAGFLFAAIGVIVLDRVYNERIRNFEEFLFPTVGWAMGWVVETAITLFMFSVLCIMTAGSGIILSDRLGIPMSFATVLTAFVYMVLIMTSIRGIMAISSVVTPVLFAGVVIVGFCAIALKNSAVFSFAHFLKSATHNWFFSSLLYVSYNSITSVVMLCNLQPYLKTRKTAILGGMAGGAALCFAALIINFSIWALEPYSLKSELPVPEIAGEYSGLLGDIYSVVLWFAMLVSGVISGYCFIGRLSARIKAVDKRILTPIVCALAIPLSGFGFSNLISAIYPVFGYIGMFMVFVIIMHGIKNVASMVRKNKTG